MKYALILDRGEILPEAADSEVITCIVYPRWPFCRPGSEALLRKYTSGWGAQLQRKERYRARME